MPHELPGFYFDAEKNQDFPIKDPIPGSKSKPPQLQLQLQLDSRSA